MRVYRETGSSGSLAALPPDELALYLSEVRELVLEEIDRMVPRGTRYDADLYDLVRDYPFRPAKMLRPAVAYAVCRAAGGRAEEILATATVFELFHNAFLIHDDVEDGSLSRRAGPTLHRAHGMPIAVNVGDAMLAMCLRPLLDNTKQMGVGRALKVLSIVAEMAAQTARGQALELGWIRRQRWDLTGRDYFRMVHQKTTWYTFLAPAIAGATVAGVSAPVVRRLRWWATLLGVAFQIQDDLLNLESQDREAHGYGKEMAGDLWESKRTLILLETLREVSSSDRRRAIEILDTDRAEKRGEDVAWLHDTVRESSAMSRVRGIARRWCEAAAIRLADLAPSLDLTGAVDSVHVRFLAGLTQYVLERTR